VHAHARRLTRHSTRTLRASELHHGPEHAAASRSSLPPEPATPLELKRWCPALLLSGEPMLASRQPEPPARALLLSTPLVGRVAAGLSPAAATQCAGRCAAAEAAPCGLPERGMAWALGVRERGSSSVGGSAGAAPLGGEARLRRLCRPAAAPTPVSSASLAATAARPLMGAAVWSWGLGVLWPSSATPTVPWLGPERPPALRGWLLVRTTSAATGSAVASPPMVSAVWVAGLCQSAGVGAQEKRTFSTAKHVRRQRTAPRRAFARVQGLERGAGVHGWLGLLRNGGYKRAATWRARDIGVQGSPSDLVGCVRQQLEVMYAAHLKVAVCVAARSEVAAASPRA
jgi:hypothetical protein